MALTKGGKMKTDFLKMEQTQVLMRGMLRFAMQYATQMSYIKPNSPKLPEIKRYYAKKINGFLEEIDKLPKDAQADLFGTLVVMRDEYAKQEIIKKRSLQFAFAKECKCRCTAIDYIFDIKNLRNKKKIKHLQK